MYNFTLEKLIGLQVIEAEGKQVCFVCHEPRQRVIKAEGKQFVCVPRTKAEVHYVIL